MFVESVTNLDGMLNYQARYKCSYITRLSNCFFFYKNQCNCVLGSFTFYILKLYQKDTSKLLICVVYSFPSSFNSIISGLENLHIYLISPVLAVRRLLTLLTLEIERKLHLLLKLQKKSVGQKSDLSSAVIMTWSTGYLFAFLVSYL